MQNLPSRSCIPPDQRLSILSSTPISNKHKNVSKKPLRGIKRLSAKFISENVSKVQSANKVSTNYGNVITSLFKSQQHSFKKFKSRKSEERLKIIKDHAKEYSISSISSSENEDSGISYNTPVSMELCTSLEDFSTSGSIIINETKSDTLQTQTFNPLNSDEISENSAYTPITMRNLDTQKSLYNTNTLRMLDDNCVSKKNALVQTCSSKVLQDMTNIPIKEKTLMNYSSGSIEGNVKSYSNEIIPHAEARLQMDEQTELSFDIEIEHSYCKRPDFLCNENQHRSMSSNKDILMENENLKMHSPKIQENCSIQDELINCLSDENFTPDSASMLPITQTQAYDLNDQISMDIDEQSNSLEHFNAFSPPVSPIYKQVQTENENIQIVDYSKSFEDDNTIIEKILNEQIADKNPSMETPMRQSSVSKPCQSNPTQNCRRSSRNKISPEEYRNGKRSKYVNEIVDGLFVPKFVGPTPTPTEPVRRISKIKSKKQNKKRGRPKKTLTTTIELAPPDITLQSSLQFSQTPNTQPRLSFIPSSSIRVEQSQQTIPKFTFKSNNNTFGQRDDFEWKPLENCHGIFTTSFITDKFGENEKTVLGKIWFKPKAEKTKLKTGNYTTYFTVDTATCLLVKIFHGTKCIHKSTIKSYSEIASRTEYSITNLRNEAAILNFTITKNN